MPLAPLPRALRALLLGAAVLGAGGVAVVDSGTFSVNTAVEGGGV